MKRLAFLFLIFSALLAHATDFPNLWRIEFRDSLWNEDRERNGKEEGVTSIEIGFHKGGCTPLTTRKFLPSGEKLPEGGRVVLRGQKFTLSKDALAKINRILIGALEKKTKFSKPLKDLPTPDGSGDEFVIKAVGRSYVIEVREGEWGDLGIQEAVEEVFKIVAGDIKSGLLKKVGPESRR